jgi:hypothetical protein
MEFRPWRGHCCLEVAVNQEIAMRIAATLALFLAAAACTVDGADTDLENEELFPEEGGGAAPFGAYGELSGWVYSIDGGWSEAPGGYFELDHTGGFVHIGRSDLPGLPAHGYIQLGALSARGCGERLEYVRYDGPSRTRIVIQTGSLAIEHDGDRRGIGTDPRDWSGTLSIANFSCH